MNLPIALTLFRIVLVPLIIVFVISSDRLWVLIAAVIFVAASLTDWLDGRMARRWNQVTKLGTLLDPVADKLLVASALLALVEMQLAPAWMVLIILGRELVVMGLRNIALMRGFSIAVSDVGKLKMATQVFAISALILGVRFQMLETLGVWGLWAVVVLSLISAAQYIREFRNQAGLPGKRRPLPHPLLSLVKQQKTDATTQR